MTLLLLVLVTIPHPCLLYCLVSLLVMSWFVVSAFHQIDVAYEVQITYEPTPLEMKVGWLVVLFAVTLCHFLIYNLALVCDSFLLSCPSPLPHTSFYSSVLGSCF